MGKSVNWVKCPIDGCKRKAHTIGGLEYHLFENHIKMEVVKALLKVLGYYTQGNEERGREA